MRTFATYLTIAAIALFIVDSSLAAPMSSGRHGSPKANRAVPANPEVLITEDLSKGLTLEDIIAALVGSSSIAISNVSFTGSDSALGTFTGGTGIIGFEQGIVLSTGLVENVVGPNSGDGTGYGHALLGDPDLDSLIPGFETEDACILEFDFECPAVREIGFEYVFSSEEYNEFVYNSYNDVFGFFVNGENIALLPDGQTVVSIDNVNGGNPIGDSARNALYYINNDECQFSTVPSCPVNTEMDGLTVVLIAKATIQPGINHIKLAIADAGDDIYDSDVFLKGQSFVCGAVNNNTPTCAINPSGPFSLEVGNNLTFTVTGTDPDDGQSIYMYPLGNLPPGSVTTPTLPRAGLHSGLSSQFSWTPTQAGVYNAGFYVTDSLGGSDTASVQITVTQPQVNNPPVCVINPTGPFTLETGTNLSFTVTGTDPDDGQTIYLYPLGNPPPGSVMTPSLPRAGSRTGLSSQFSWTPSQAGVYTAGFIVTDSLGGADTASVVITVTSPEVNDQPVCIITPPGPFTVNAGTNVTFAVSATDPDPGQVIRLANLGTLPQGATMTPSVPLFGPWTGVSSQFSWTPSQVGSFLARFSASDSAGGFDSISARINVLEGVAPFVSDASPADGVFDVPWNTAAIVEFSEVVQNNCNMATSPLPCVTLSSARRGVVGFDEVWNGSILAITPESSWPDDDTITITLSGELRDAAGNRLDGDRDGLQEGTPTDDYSFSFFTSPGVFEGDANDDGTVDERDVLPLGVHYLRTGPTRARNTNSWALEFARPWVPDAATHADCDGNGVIDSTDICSILEFFDRTIPAKRSPTEAQFDALSSLDVEIRAALTRALLECDGGSPIARARLLDALRVATEQTLSHPRSFNLAQNYPNPFNAGTVIAWEMNVPSHVELTIFDILGRRVRNLVDDDRPAGYYTAEWDGRGDDGDALASGVYVYRLSIDKQSSTKRMVLIR
jgi:hypothetical protein